MTTTSDITAEVAALACDNPTRQDLINAVAVRLTRQARQPATAEQVAELLDARADETAIQSLASKHSGLDDVTPDEIRLAAQYLRGAPWR